MKTLSEKKEFTVRLSDTDTLGVVWHGNYIQYFEDGREAFGEKYGIRYLDIYEHDIVAPLVDIKCEYLSPLRYGDKAIVETTFINNPAAKIVFEYVIYQASDNKIVARGSSTQAFLTTKGEFQITVPPFFADWKKKHKLL